jgi:uncharacterized protein YjbI with pentapeptide repeats
VLHRPNKTAGGKRGLIETSAYDALLPYVAGPDEPPRYALHFGTVDKVGVNPRSEHDTPLAVCAYPLTEEIFEQFLKIELPFAQREAKYLYLLEIRPEARVFYSTPQFFKQGVGPEYVGDADESREFFYSTQPEDYEDAPKYASEEHQTVARAAQWGRKLMDMGIDVWVDADREGILHESEPSQTMFFSPLSYSIVFSMDNPKDRFVARYGRDWRKWKDVRDMDMAGANLSKAQLWGVDLTSANLARTDLEGADLREANLTGATLTGAVLIEADLTGAKLRGAKLGRAKLHRAYLRDVKYDNSTVWPNSVRDVLRVWRGDKNLTSADLTFAKLDQAALTGADLSGANLDFAWLDQATLTGANLRGAKLGHAKLTGADLTDADLTNAVLTRAILTNAVLTRAILSHADLSSADLTGANLRGAYLTGADLYLAYLKDVKYDNSTVWPDSVRDVLRVWRGGKNFTDADLTDADLTDADLTDAILTDAILIGAILIGADLTGANLRGADLEGIDYDETTKWPAGFTPPPSTLRLNRR